MDELFEHLFIVGVFLFIFGIFLDLFQFGVITLTKKIMKKLGLYGDVVDRADPE